MSREQFTDFVTDAIVGLPQDLKAVLRVVEDPEISDDGRVLAAGALISALTGTNHIPGMRGILAYVDDVLVIRLVMERLEKENAEAIGRHREESPEFLGELDAELAVTRAFLGDLISVLEKAVDGVSKLSHEGHSAKECVQDMEANNWLYGAVHGAIVESFEFDDDDVAREVKGIQKIIPALKSRVS